MRLRIDLAYDGAPYHGFARQPRVPTVQAVLEDALATLLGQPITLVAAGRTDRGVHADQQVAHLDVDLGVARAARAVEDVERLGRHLDHNVGDAITIWQVRRVPLTFHARFSATSRTYRYRLVDGPTIHPLRRHEAWHLGRPLAIALMRTAARHLVGEHDFSAFCRRSDARTPVRTVRSITVSRPAPGEVVIGVRGESFCQQQVRSLVGALVEVGRSKRPPQWVGELLQGRERGRIARVAPPHGLTLAAVAYGRPRAG